MLKHMCIYVSSVNHWKHLPDFEPPDPSDGHAGHGQSQQQRHLRARAVPGDKQVSLLYSKPPLQRSKNSKNLAQIVVKCFFFYLFSEVWNWWFSPILERGAIQLSLLAYSHKLSVSPKPSWLYQVDPPNNDKHLCFISLNHDWIN